MKTVQISYRVPEARKLSVDKKLSAMGYSLTEVCNALLQYIDENDALPFVFRTEVKTLGALQQRLIADLATLCQTATLVYRESFSSGYISRTPRDRLIALCDDYNTQLEKDLPALSGAGMSTLSALLTAAEKAGAMARTLRLLGGLKGFKIMLDSTKIGPELSALNQCLDELKRLDAAGRLGVPLPGAGPHLAEVSAAAAGGDEASVERGHRREIQKRIARKWRTEKGISGGFVLMSERNVLAWCPDLDRPAGLTPGCVAFNNEDAEWLACGGDEIAGATAWVPVWVEPA